MFLPHAQRPHTFQARQQLGGQKWSREAPAPTRKEGWSLMLLLPLVLNSKAKGWPGRKQTLEPFPPPAAPRLNQWDAPWRIGWSWQVQKVSLKDW